MTARLRRNDYAAVRRAVEARVAAMGTDGTTPLDVRSAEALVSMLVGSGSGAADGSAHAAAPTIVAHVALKYLVALPGRPASSLVAELERAGLISAEILERLACDAIFIVGLDDEAGHTMYEGRAHRFPSETQRRELAAPRPAPPFSGLYQRLVHPRPPPRALEHRGADGHGQPRDRVRPSPPRAPLETLERQRRRQRRTLLRRPRRSGDDLSPFAVVGHDRRGTDRRTWSKKGQSEDRRRRDENER